MIKNALFFSLSFTSFNYLTSGNFFSSGPSKEEVYFEKDLERFNKYGAFHSKNVLEELNEKIERDQDPEDQEEVSKIEVITITNVTSFIPEPEFGIASLIGVDHNNNEVEIQFERREIFSEELVNKEFEEGQSVFFKTLKSGKVGSTTIYCKDVPYFATNDFYESEDGKKIVLAFRCSGKYSDKIIYVTPRGFTVVGFLRMFQQCRQVVIDSSGKMSDALSWQSTVDDFFLWF